ncbi:MAG: ROK family protein [Pseudomonadota bacterium]
MTTQAPPLARLGIDLGGTKIEGAVLAPDGTVLARQRIATPRDDYRATLHALAALCDTLDPPAAPGTRRLALGLGMPGSLDPATGLVQNANSTWLNGQPLARDAQAITGRPVRTANDADCFALSEARDGAAAGARIVFGVILGTGVGGAIVVDGRLLAGPRAIAGEWGHTPLPAPRDDERPGPRCWCGRYGCLEAWLSGPALARDHANHTGEAANAEEIAARASNGDATARATLTRHVDRLARGLAVVVNLIDPDVIVLGGGLSAMGHLYRELPPLILPHLFCDSPNITVRPPRHGDASGVRGAAWLWP